MKKLFLLFQMTLLSLIAFAQSKPYAVLSNGGQTVTFYYDNQKANRGGIDINNSYNWENKSPYGTATTAVFDGSFASYRPVSTAYWFQACSSLTTINGINNLNTINVTDMSYMFRDCSGLKSIDLSGFKTYNVTDMSCIFDGCSGLTSLDVTGFNTSNVTDMTAMFQNCSGLTSLDVTGFKTYNVTRMICMFNGCSGLTSLDVSGFDTSKVTDINGMFQHCSGLTSLDVSGFNTSKVTDISSMFTGCSGLKSIDVSGFKTSKVIYMHNLFWDCSGLMSLDLSGFDTSNVTHMHYMFFGCSRLTNIYVGDDWNTSKVTTSDAMFAYCTSLVGGNGTTYSEDHITVEYARLDEPGRPGYFTPKAQKMDIIEDGATIKIGDEIDQNTDIDGNIVGDVYYSINSSDGSYDSTDGCIVVSKPTDDSAIDGQSIFSEDFNDNYTGIVFRVAPGSGTIMVQAMTTGNMVLKVKIGDGNPDTNELSGKQTVSFPYNVSTVTYVYIYGSNNSSQARSHRAGANGELRIYGIEMVGGLDNIENIESSKFNNQSSKIYNLNGQRINMPKKGIYIQNGKKVLVK